MGGVMRLTEYSRGSGWACKLSPSELAQDLSQFKNHKALSASTVYVGLYNPDDSGVVRASGENHIQSIDFFTPLLDNPYD